MGRFQPPAWFDKVVAKGYHKLVQFRPITIERRRWRRLIGFLLFVALFSLPLHFHPMAVTAPVAKECSCLHGNRYEFGLAPAHQDWAPSLISSSVSVESHYGSDSPFDHRPHSRAPPLPF